MAAEEGTEKRERKPNWTADDRVLLTTYVIEFKHIIRGKLGPIVT